jgi:hypothetical protein
LCALFTVALAVESAITVAPGGESAVRLLMGLSAALAATFATVAVTFKRLRVPEPKWLVRVFLGVALVATVVVVLTVVG